MAARTSIAPSTRRSYAGHVRLYLKPYLGQVLLADLSAGHVEAMFAAVTRHHQALGSQVSSASVEVDAALAVTPACCWRATIVVIGSWFGS